MGREWSLSNDLAHNVCANHDVNLNPSLLAAYGPHPSIACLRMCLSECLLYFDIVSGSTTTSGSTFQEPTTLFMFIVSIPRQIFFPQYLHLSSLYLLLSCLLLKVQCITEKKIRFIQPLQVQLNWISLIQHYIVQYRPEGRRPARD